MLDPRPPLAVADADEEPEEVGVGASVWMENICSDDEDWAMTTGISTCVLYIESMSRVTLSRYKDGRCETYLA
jgi:hypothetical protein